MRKIDFPQLSLTFMESIFHYIGYFFKIIKEVAFTYLHRYKIHLRKKECKMKAKRRIAWLLSFLMVFSLLMETSKMQVFAAGGAGETAFLKFPLTVRIPLKN